MDRKEARLLQELYATQKAFDRWWTRFKRAFGQLIALRQRQKRLNQRIKVHRDEQSARRARRRTGGD